MSFCCTRSADMEAASLRVASAAERMYCSATPTAELTIACVRCENHVSRPRLRVTNANTATTMAGTTAIRLKRETSRMCSPAPGVPFRHSRSSTNSWLPISAPMRMRMRKLPTSRKAVISLVGVIGVRLVRMAKVTNPARIPTNTKPAPTQLVSTCNRGTKPCSDFLNISS